MKTPIRIGVTLGDANGVGPEIALKAAHDRRRPKDTCLVLIGSRGLIERQARRLRLPAPKPWSPANGRCPRGTTVLWDPAPSLAPPWKPGEITIPASRAAEAWIRAAVSACRKGWLDAMVTAPISKEGFHRAGFRVPGHTEFLAELTGAKRFAMMLFGGPLKVVLVTRHVPLGKVTSVLTKSAVIEAIRLTGQALPWLGCARRRIAVCGLNPHAGDGGALGREEMDIIGPAIRVTQKEGFDTVGPVPADVVFHQAIKGSYDAVVAMYHDQGLGPLKMLAFECGVNVTLGLPIVRTSPDHGTAFDIAGRGVASPSSMVEAVRWAAKLTTRKNPWKR